MFLATEGCNPARSGGSQGCKRRCVSQETSPRPAVSGTQAFEDIRLRHENEINQKELQEGHGTPQIQRSSQLSPMRVLMSCFTRFWQTHPAPIIFSQGIIKIK